MTKRKGALILLGGLFAFLLVLGGTAAIAQAIELRDSAAKVAVAGDVDAMAYQDAADTNLRDHHGTGEGDSDPPGHHGHAGHHGHGKGEHGFHHQLEGVTPIDELLAAELGISAEALHEAMAEAHAAARAQAEQDGDGHFRGRHHAANEQYQALLAEALGKTVEELEDAQAASKAAYLAELVEAGIVTQEQLDMMEAKRALGEMIDPEALLAEALGIELAELKAAREAGDSLRELLGERSFEEFAAATMAAYEAAVLQAAADGVITDAQAEAILNNGFGFGRGHGHGFGHGHGYDPHHGGPAGPRGFGPGHRSLERTGVSL